MALRTLHRKCVFRQQFCQIYAQRPIVTVPHSRLKHLPHITHKHCMHSLTDRKINLVTPIFMKAEEFRDRIALIDQHGVHEYGRLLSLAHTLADKLIEVGNISTKGNYASRVCFLCANDASYVVTQWATWIAEAMAVPLATSHPPSELKYVIEDTDCAVVVCTEEFEEKLKPIMSEMNKPLLVLCETDYINKGDDSQSCKIKLASENVRKNRWKTMWLSNRFKQVPSLIVYTSGTTGRPKGVVHTHGSLTAQMDGMTNAWQWSERDVVLHSLPLHHVHGIVNVLMTPFYNGATSVMLPRFDAKEVWSKLMSPVTADLPRSINVFMAVPTVYAKLIEYHKKAFGHGRTSKKSKEYIHAVCQKKIRLMVSGSAALPQPIMHEWERITGHRLLERYGMTEIGMALTNPLAGQRVPGLVGMPFPGVEVAITAPDVYSKRGFNIHIEATSRKTKIVPGSEGDPGELLVRGGSLFKEYWMKPEATKESFTEDGWFKTGDTACYTEGGFKIMGRTSVDIIKSGGYKISALDVERHLLGHDNIQDVAVVGLPDMTWGQRVAAIVVLKPDTQLTLSSLKLWATDVLPPYQIPSILKTIDEMPRNAMGKINKKDLLKTYFSKELRAVM